MLDASLFKRPGRRPHIRMVTLSGFWAVRRAQERLIPESFGCQFSQAALFLIKYYVPMSDFKFGCSHCGQHIQCDVKFSGRQIQCPGCNHLIVIPPPTSTEKFQPQSGMTWATYVPPAGEEPVKKFSINKEKKEQP